MVSLALDAEAMNQVLDFGNVPWLEGLLIGAIGSALYLFTLTYLVRQVIAGKPVFAVLIQLGRIGSLVVLLSFLTKAGVSHLIAGLISFSIINPYLVYLLGVKR